MTNNNNNDCIYHIIAPHKIRTCSLTHWRPLYVILISNILVKVWQFTNIGTMLVNTFSKICTCTVYSCGTRLHEMNTLQVYPFLLSCNIRSLSLSLSLCSTLHSLSSHAKEKAHKRVTFDLVHSLRYKPTRSFFSPPIRSTHANTFRFGVLRTLLLPGRDVVTLWNFDFNLPPEIH